VATHYWHPSFGVQFRDFLELRDPQLDQSGLGDGYSIPNYPLPYDDKQEHDQDSDEDHY
jgi:hypothetical protein